MSRRAFAIFMILALGVGIGIAQVDGMFADLSANSLVCTSAGCELTNVPTAPTATAGTATTQIATTAFVGNAIGTQKLIQSGFSANGCTTGGNSYDTCTISITWPVAFPDTSYVANCSPYGVTSSQGPGILTSSGVSAETTTGITWTWATDAAQTVTVGYMGCTAREN